MARWNLRRRRPRQAPPKSTRPRLTQYYRSPAAAKPTPRPKPRSGIKQRLCQLLKRLALAALILAFGYNLLLKPTPRFSVDSAAYRPASTYQQAVVAELKGLKNRNKLTIDQSAMARNLKRQMPEIAAVSVSSPWLGHTPTVKLRIAAPALLLNATSGLYLIDEQGIAVAKAEALPALSKLPRLEDQSGFTVNIGKPILNTAAISFVNTIISQAKRANVPIVSLSLPPLAQQLDLRTADRNYYVKFYLAGDALNQIGQWLAARHNFDATGSQPSQYVDVRVSGKLFYK